jgi:tetratricopeptide (TPR) repeat protein
MQLGTAYAWLKQYDDAIPILKKAVEMRPDTLMPNYLLGLSLSSTGDWASSVPYFEAAVEKSPKWGALHFSLAAAYARINRLDEAQKELEKAVQVEPDNFRAQLVLGRMLTVQGKAAQGITNLKQAVKLQPNVPEGHLFLAEAYARLGQRQLALRERAEAERLKSNASPPE